MKGKQVPLPALAISLVMLATAAQGATLKYDWVVDYAFWAPDCVEKLIIAVNGEYPGPTIRATAGDTIIVNVMNKMPTEGVVIHWHGITMIGTPWDDGTAYVSQCPINPEEEYIYKFLVPRAGTYFWHGHYGMQRAAGFYGSLIVESAVKEPFSYNGSLRIVLNDWWHSSMYEQQRGLYSKPFRWIGEPQSLLIEGRGSYNCSSVPKSAATCEASPQCSPYILSVEPGKTYRLRIASVASLSSFNFILEGHNFTVVEADGHYVDPVQLSDLDVYSGESYSVLFTADQDASRNYWAAVNVRGRKPATPTGLAVLNYLPNPPTLLPTTAAPISPAWDDYDYSMNKARLYVARKDFEVPPPDRPTNRTIFLLNTQNLMNGVLKWAINNLTIALTSTPVLAGIKYANRIQDESTVPPDYYSPGYDIYNVPSNPNTTSGSGYYEFKPDDVVDVILQNANTLTINNSEVHPWHLHGHDFWILGYGSGSFKPSSDYTNLNYVNPPLRNTVPLFPYGWTVIRFVADNPGVWPFHCHIEPHFHMGMGVLFVDSVEQFGSIDIPKEALGCGRTKGWIDPTKKMVP